MTESEQRNPAECPPGESLTAWLRAAPRKKGRARSRAEIDLHAKARAELRNLIPQAVAEAKKRKLALLRLIARATKSDPTLHAVTVRELAKLLPAAALQARTGSPALLRLILRATR